MVLVDQSLDVDSMQKQLRTVNRRQATQGRSCISLIPTFYWVNEHVTITVCVLLSISSHLPVPKLFGYLLNLAS